jgi:hypothetical protein
METQPPRFQFSIRLMLVATAAIAAAVGAALPEPSWQSCLALEFLAFFFASIGVMAAFKSRGAFRVFWIAATTPASGGAAVYFFYGCLAGASSIMTEPAETLVMVTGGMRVALPVLWCFSLANGALCGLIYCLIWSRSPEPRP